MLNNNVSPRIPVQVTFAGENIELTLQDRRERMDREMLSFCYSHINTMLQIKRANRLFPIVEPILVKHGIPSDFKYLMIIECNGDVEARSGAGAAGPWQFLEKTGRLYGLEVNGEVDERYNIEKATVAACKYLKESYEEYGDWLTVAASYNTGRANVTKRINAQKEDKAINLVLLPETSRYIFRLLAVKTIFSNPQAYGFILKESDLY
ncbi:MAG: lytic transglycosylase domain-containing protein, partial [Bacteroidaceae bacterium]|nr:lytic transglycosylase domain-containing protein [Bacteroidaceae bacterium]